MESFKDYQHYLEEYKQEYPDFDDFQIVSLAHQRVLLEINIRVLENTEFLRSTSNETKDSGQEHSDSDKLFGQA
jgi:hypothetical protein